MSRLLGIKWWAFWLSKDAVESGAAPFLVYRYVEYDKKKRKYVFEEKSSTHLLLMTKKELLTNSQFKPFLIEHDAIMDFLEDAKKRGINAVD